ncbi:glycosyltransferase [Reichenbachiella versicolor]|uniref:glycosyltransferase n=1 Tax=Reichenbachiella versicolor TaxID=1821036 RepID=UPI000D6DF3D4|nr:glycosyltransferase family 2 protein [Reichenbachiella versicolor]
MKIIIEILTLLLLTYVSLSVIYQFILAISAKFYKPLTSKVDVYNKFLVLVPSYKADAAALRSTKMNVNVQYPKDSFDIVVINDGLEDSTQVQLEEMGASVLNVSFEKSTKVKALQEAVKRINSISYDGVVVLDVDNIMQPDFLTHINHSFNEGTYAVQGRRIAENLTNSTSAFDAVAETANHEMLCKGVTVFGLSSKLSGSGMAFRQNIFHGVIEECTAIGGFDKEMELVLTYLGIKIDYNDEAIVLDEKVDSYEAMAKQRSRWLQAQYNFLAKFLKSGFRNLFKGNFDHFHKVLQLALPPRALMVVILLIAGIIGLVLGTSYIVIIAALMIVANVMTYVITVPIQWLLKFGFKMIIDLPKMIWSAIKALFLMPAAAKKFIHTQH